MAAVLHDVVEDSNFTLDDLRDAGYRRTVVDAIDALTRRSAESYERYIERVVGNSIAGRVKTADLEENLANDRRSPDALGNADRIRRYEAALQRLRVM
jgi:GTP diphosphokinase / guanosine-3',5'-bis(diphosphate) 3'-diphosphatase